MPRARRRPLALILALALVLGSGGAAWAYWTSAATAASSATSLTVAVSQSGFPAAAYRYQNHDLRSASVATVTNTGQTAGTLTLALAASSGATFAAAMPVTVWRVASAATCTATAAPVAPVATGTWSSLSMTVPGTLAAGASASFCVQTVVPSRQAVAAASGTQTSAATLTATLDDAAGWVGTVSAPGSATRVTELIYPFAQVGSVNYVQEGLSNWFTLRTAGPALCLDVSASGGTGTRAITWTCHNDANQRWEIIPDDANPGLVQLRPKHANGLATRLTVTGSAATIATANGTAAQLWEIQRIGDNAFQLVAHGNGQCLTMATTSGDVQIATATCSSSARGPQVFALAREPLTFAVAGSGNSPTVTLGIAAVPGVAYQVQRQLANYSWSTITTSTTGTAVSFTANTTNVPRNVTTQYRVVVTGTDTVVYGNVRLSRDNQNAVTATGGFN